MLKARWRFDVVEYKDDVDVTLACMQGELLTTGFSFLEDKRCSMFRIEVVNQKCAFDYTIESCLINGKEIQKSECFQPAIAN